MKRVGFMIKQLNNLYCRNINNIAAKYDVTFMQMEVLMRVIRANNKSELINQRDIEKLFSISNPTVTGILNRLESKELIRRVPCKEDKRIRYIYPSDKARELDIMLKESFDHCDALLLEGFDDVETKEVFNYLEKMIENIK